MIWLHLLVAYPVFLAFRLLPLWHIRNRGCDAYYFLLAAEKFREQKRIPVHFGGLYLLEEDEQWYPPLFYMLLAVLPPSWLARVHWAINNVLDGLIALGLFAFVAWHAGPAWAWAALLAYATSHALLTEYQALTSRSLSAVWLQGFLISGYLGLTAHPGFWAGAVLAACLLLYTHKLSVQLLWVLAPALAIVRGEPEWIYAWLGGFAMAWLVGRGFFWKILRAHWDILMFWRRNLPWLGAHQVRQSPVYGNAAPGGFHAATLRERIRLHLDRLIRTNLLAGGMALLALLSWPADEPLRFLLQVTVVVYLWAGLTLFLPPLRFLGEGNKYLKYAIPPVLAYLAIAAAGNPPWWQLLLLAPIILWWLRYYYLNVRQLQQPSAWIGEYSGDMRAMTEKIRGLDCPRVMCISSHIADLLAYHGRVQVFWGTHGYGFKMVEPFFPIIRRPLEDFVRQYGLTHLLLDSGYASPEELRLGELATEIDAIGQYRLFAFQRI